MAQAEAKTRPTFTRRTPKRRTRPGVRVADAIARFVITVGGIGTIVAVLTVCVFLIWVALPLFEPASIERVGSFGVVGAPPIPVRAGIDDSGRVLWELQRDGSIQVRLLRTGQVVQRGRLFEGPPPTATALSPKGDALYLGFADGTVRTATVSTEVEDVPVEASTSKSEPNRGGALVENKGKTQLLRLRWKVGEPTKAAPAAIRLVDYTSRPDGSILATFAADGRLRLQVARKRKNLITGETSREQKEVLIPLDPRGGAAEPSYLFVSGAGDVLYLAWDDGRLMRYDLRDLERPMCVESLSLLRSDGDRLTALTMLTGKTTLAAGDSSGRITTWFPTLPEGADAAEGTTLAMVRELRPAGAAIASLAPSPRSRILAAGDAAGSVAIYHTTTGNRLGEAQIESAVRLLAFGPKESTLVAITDHAFVEWAFDARHPEAGVEALFAPVWYENYSAPASVWQSTSASDDFEPKLSLLPLVFGTLKATIYSMLFGAPLAILGAIFTSEFLSPRAKTWVKPSIELMASLPSVVLGFLAGLVLAPFVDRWTAVVLAGFFTIPFSYLLGAYLWQLLPQPIGQRLLSVRFPLLFLVIPAGVYAAILLGPLADRLLFGGDFKAWLDGERSGTLGGWTLTLLPLCAVGSIFLTNRVINPWLTRASARWTRATCVLADLFRFVLSSAATVAAAALIAYFLSAGGLDPRDTVLGTYVQRNALVVGFVMGFAVIPIIYTIAEDALSSVPEHLRSASLGAGATPWQTATRIILPTAASGIFSALMVGLGRAVGETMIVLMAAGNTPILDFNIFSGFRTLSANLAVELPEAVRNSTHYRTLFLAALVLFIMTFLLNTAAEAVRQRFRKRAYQL